MMKMPGRFGLTGAFVESGGSNRGEKIENSKTNTGGLDSGSTVRGKKHVGYQKYRSRC